jgi:hypothetical protein
MQAKTKMRGVSVDAAPAAIPAPAPMIGKQTAWLMFLVLAVSVFAPVRSHAAETNRVVLVELTIGRVLHVNANYSYVILQCGSLPSPGEEAKVFHGDAVVARLKINSCDRFPFVAADVIEGEPREGDSVKQVMKKFTRSPDDGRKE